MERQWDVISERTGTQVGHSRLNATVTIEDAQKLIAHGFSLVEYKSAWQSFGAALDTVRAAQ